MFSYHARGERVYFWFLACLGKVVQIIFHSFELETLQAQTRFSFVVISPERPAWYAAKPVGSAQTDPTSSILATNYHVHIVI
eukprot:COSAG06_NODE_4682_length_4037_cov_11.317166_2_plen_82_part_00